jgi:hypothetical protein
MLFEADSLTKESEEEAVKLLEQAWTDSKLPLENLLGVSVAEEKLKRTTELLHRLIRVSVLDPKQRKYLPSPIVDLSSLIKSTKVELEKLTERQDAVDSNSKGMLSTTGKIVQESVLKLRCS